MADVASRINRLKWFTAGVSIILILLCNAMFVVGWWVSGVNLDRALSNPEIYDPTNSYCVQVVWTHVIGVEGPVKVCSEWLDVSDPSGNTHALRQDTALAMAADGQLYYQGQREEDFRLMGLVVFVIVVVGLGVWVKHYLIVQYRIRLQASEGKPC